MAIELKFSKPDSFSSWGFRLVGGVDFNEPLVVVKVNEKSLAENAGLQVGDIIVRVNDTPTSGLTHNAAHDLIHQAGFKFIIAVRRGLFSDIPVPTEDENNTEVEDILKNSFAEHFEDIQKDQHFGSSPTFAENLAGQEQLISADSLDGKTLKRVKKWSTFLQKPKNPKPAAKKVELERKIIGEPYRVKIVKQKKRDPNEVLYQKKTVHFEPNVTEVEYSSDSAIEESIGSAEVLEFKSEDEMEIETSVKGSEETVMGMAEFIENQSDKDLDTIENDSLENGIEEQENANIRKQKPIIKPTPSLDIHIDPVICESSLSLEDQLAAVQKQLLALSQLPSAIQLTLEAVTNQLNKIVLEKTKTRLEEYYVGENNRNLDTVENGNVSDITTEEENFDENLSISENAEGDITENEGEENNKYEELEKDQESNEVSGQTLEDNSQENSDKDEENTEKNTEIDPFAGLTEEEKEEKIREEQLKAKKLKEEEEKRKTDWAQRPIILPGGRKWSDPDDITPKFKNKKMTDDKISQTIENYSEVIKGKTKGWTIGTIYGRGATSENRSTESLTALWYPARYPLRLINFLKYQPPPKNLDYLQKSEVYRLIHGMEPPVKGVGARAEKILSEKDYYGDKGAS